jgi:spore photoproduct lyase
MTPKNQAKQSKTKQASDLQFLPVNSKNDVHAHEVIHTKPGQTSDGKPFDHVVKDMVTQGTYRLQILSAEITDTLRPIEVYRATRAKSNIIKQWEPQTDDESYCPAHWSDLAIGRGACGFRCRACFLMLTHRVFCDPSRHVLYENVDDYLEAVKKELQIPGPNIGLGTDCSDSLLYEGVTGHARRLIPLFANTQYNPFRRKLILLTKSTNIHYLEGLPTENVLMTFSLNPEPIADLWEGKWNDGVRITPSIMDRLAASALTQEIGFEVRWRIDPILPVDGWKEIYRDFLVSVAAEGHRPTRITLGTYREMGRSLLTIAQKWGLPPMNWTPPKLSKDGMHYHIEESKRIEIYRCLTDFIQAAWRPYDTPIAALCKESKQVRNAVDLNHDHCNCE